MYCVSCKMSHLVLVAGRFLQILMSYGSHKTNSRSFSINHIIPIMSIIKSTVTRRHQFSTSVDECSYEPLKGNDHIKTAHHQCRPTVKRGSWIFSFVRPREEVEAELSSAMPGLVRCNSISSLESSSEDSSTISSSITSIKKKGVTFSETVTSHHIPHSSSYTPLQRRRMYTSSEELRQNRIRNRKEYRYDGCDWRNCTEEWEMSICLATGELIHPVHRV